jgi:AmpE protein
MKFLTVLMLTIYYRNWVGKNPLQEMFPVESWFSWVGSRFSDEKVKFALSAVLPSLVVLFISTETSGLFLGLFWLVLSVAIVLYGIDIIDMDIVFDDQILWLRDAQKTDDLDQLQQTQANFCRDITYDVFQSVIPVLFWFLMIGPAGALFFVLGQRYLEYKEEEEQGELEFLYTIFYWLEWVPSRLTIVLFALLGNFGRTYQVMAESVFDFTGPVSTTLHESARSSVLVERGSSNEEADLGFDDFISSSKTELDDLKMLLERSLWGWVGIAALLTILGL